jgi:hypothetical protein
MQCFRETGWKLIIFANSCQVIFFLFPIGWQPHFPVFISFPANRNFWTANKFFKISQKLSKCVKEFSRGYPITFGYFRATFLLSFSITKQIFNSLLRAFPRNYRKNAAVLSFFSAALRFLFTFLKSRRCSGNSCPLLI